MVRNFATIRQASAAAVTSIIELAGAAIAARDIFTLVLAGGSTPRLTYELLGEPGHAGRMDWQQCHLFWGDERWVEESHPDSNYGLAAGTLLAKVDLPARNIHRITTGYPSPEIAAAEYEKHLRRFFLAKSGPARPDATTGQPRPRFDLVLLGMGQDGHTASLFPGSDLLEEKQKWVAAVPAGTGTPAVPRITLTLPVLNQARNVIFLLAGKEKQNLLNKILARPAEAEKLYPAARIKPSGTLLWLVAENP